MVGVEHWLFSKTGEEDNKVRRKRGGRKPQKHLIP